MLKEFSKISRVDGLLNLPGDKSISHRAVMFSAMAEGTSTIENLSNAEDVRSTINCFKGLGCSFKSDGGRLKVSGKGFKGFNKPSLPLDAGNSGTTTRLLCGLLSMQDFESYIVGDSSLSKRPMKRVMEPLNLMGGSFKATEKFTLPLTVFPAYKPKAIQYIMPIASAQVKSAILIAGLHLEEETVVREMVQTRNHTETLLGLNCVKGEGYTDIYSSKSNYPIPGEYFVPSDISTASFFIVLTLLAGNNSQLTIKNISLNSSRTGLLEILKSMGARIEITNEDKKMGEPFGDVTVYSSSLKNIDIPSELIPNIIDEIPILAVAGVFAEGDFKISGAEELRYKESDRINAICSNMKLLGLNVNETEDGFVISGQINTSDALFESYDDHRIAMAFGIMSSLLEDGGRIHDFDCVAISNPNFLNQLGSIIP
ncbi:MAG: 3-phosphoshikimate 1-carboxyvinyltransferase [Bacteroidota bacterium]|nr:3-phosphoshikimate 1-carboxyvinyltransferase [Bacteroidota bacterium]